MKQLAGFVLTGVIVLSALLPSSAAAQEAIGLDLDNDCQGFNPRFLNYNVGGVWYSEDGTVRLVLEQIVPTVEISGDFDYSKTGFVPNPNMKVDSGPAKGQVEGDKVFIKVNHQGTPWIELDLTISYRSQTLVGTWTNVRRNSSGPLTFYVDSPFGRSATIASVCGPVA